MAELPINPETGEPEEAEAPNEVWQLNLFKPDCFTSVRNMSYA